MTILANPLSHLKAAASGDIEAMRAIADHAVEMVRIGASDPSRTLIEGLMVARLAASIGNSADKGRVIAMLGLLGLHTDDEGLCNDALAEALAIAVVLADSGDEEGEIAANGVNAIVEVADAESIEQAKAYVAAYREAE